LKVWRSDVSSVLGLVVDKRDRMYVLETSTAPNGPVPFTGDIVRIDPDGTQHRFASGLFFPTGMTLGPDGNLYVSNVGFGPPAAGLGQIFGTDIEDHAARGLGPDPSSLPSWALNSRRIGEFSRPCRQ